MTNLDLEVKNIKVGDYISEAGGPLHASKEAFSFSLAGNVTLSLKIPIQDIKKCLGYFACKPFFKNKSNFQNQRHPIITENDVVCLEVNELCSKRITKELNSALSSVKSVNRVQLTPDGSRIATKYVVFSIKRVTENIVQIFKEIFTPDGKTTTTGTFRELSATGLNLILQDFGGENQQQNSSTIKKTSDGPKMTLLCEMTYKKSGAVDITPINQADVKKSPTNKTDAFVIETDRASSPINQAHVKKSPTNKTDAVVIEPSISQSSVGNNRVGDTTEKQQQSMAGNVTNKQSMAGNVTNKQSMAGNVTNKQSVAGNVTNKQSVACNVTNKQSMACNVTDKAAVAALLGRKSVKVAITRLKAGVTRLNVSEHTLERLATRKRTNDSATGATETPSKRANIHVSTKARHADHSAPQTAAVAGHNTKHTPVVIVRMKPTLGAETTGATEPPPSTPSTRLSTRSRPSTRARPSTSPAPVEVKKGNDATNTCSDATNTCSDATNTCSDATNTCSDATNTCSDTEEEASPIVVLDAGAFSIGPYKGVGLSSMELTSKELKLHFHSQTPAIRTLGGAMCIKAEHIMHVVAHASPKHTSVLFIYFSPTFLSVMCRYLQSHAEFESYKKDDDFNSYAILAIVLQPVIQSRCNKLRKVCRQIARERNLDGTILQEIDAEGAGKNLKVCFSSVLQDALATTDASISHTACVKQEQPSGAQTATTIGAPSPHSQGAPQAVTDPAQVPYRVITAVGSRSPPVHSLTTAAPATILNGPGAVNQSAVNQGAVSHNSDVITYKFIAKSASNSPAQTRVQTDTVINNGITTNKPSHQGQGDMLTSPSHQGHGEMLTSSNPQSAYVVEPLVIMPESDEFS